MKHLKQLRRTIRLISPEYLFLALLALLLLAVALLWSNHSYWAILPMTLAVGMVLVVIFNDEPDTPQIWANKPPYKANKPPLPANKTIDPENLSKIKRNDNDPIN